MSKIIYKQTIPRDTNSCVKIELPFNAKILSVSNQHESLVLHFMKDTDIGTSELRTIHRFETGEILPAGIDRINFIGTVHFDNSNYILHIFEGELIT